MLLALRANFVPISPVCNPFLAPEVAIAFRRGRGTFSELLGCPADVSLSLRRRAPLVGAALILHPLAQSSLI